MIKRLKRKFMILATLSALLLMAVLVGAMNIINYSAVVAEADRVLEVLSQPGGPGGQKPPGEPNKGDFLPHGMSPEVPYESRYFTATVSDGEIIETDTARIISVDRAAAENYATAAMSKSADRGFLGPFRYCKAPFPGGTRLIFLDCGRKLDAFYRFMWISVGIGLLGCVVVFAVFLLAAGRILRPIAESYEKQKRFITDAGHEIKTPLTIIGANIDLLEADFGENESISDIRQQTKRLSELTGDLVYLSKMEEGEKALQKVDFPISDLVSETAAAFHALAQKKEYQVQVTPGLTMHGAPDAIRQLVSVLLDNAMKYSPEGGLVSLDLTAQKKALVLSVYNTTGEALRPEQLSHLFERFYRADASRNSETGGHGIGLSIAKAIVDAHGGKITAATPTTGTDLKITVTLPM